MDFQENRFVATCAFGLEPLVSGEVASLGGASLVTSRGAVSFFASLETAYRLCLWSRFSSRVLMPLARFTAPDPDTLYENTAKVDWAPHFGPDVTFVVECVAKGSPIRNTHFAELRVKDAVADQFMARCQRRPSVDAADPDIRIHLFLESETGTLSLDLSGQSLHRRGYRGSGGEAPLKETLAAAIVSYSGWPQEASGETPILDPMCGSGTLLIEAACMYGDMAPGLGRTSYGFMAWEKHDQPLWTRLVEEARSRREKGLSKSWPMMMGFDANQGAIRAAQENIVRAGLADRIHVECRELAFVPGSGNLGPDRQGLLVVNPPYGERLARDSSLPFLYRCLGRRLDEGFRGWRAAVFTAHPALCRRWTKAVERRVPLFNGPIHCELLVLAPGSRIEEPADKTGPALIRPMAPKPSSDFANRLQKNLKRLMPWAEGEGISCFRVYDRDIPEYNVTVDLYEDRVRVGDHGARKTMDQRVHYKRRKEILLTIQDVLGVKAEGIFLWTKPGDVAGKPYLAKGATERLHEVREDPCRFLVKLTGLPDTGLPLEHRSIRRLIGEQSKGVSVLDLFCSTGTATVHAAMGGASRTLSLDPSETTLAWARKNLVLNGFSEENHRLIHGDISDSLYKSEERFDMIILSMTGLSRAAPGRRAYGVGQDAIKIVRLTMTRLRPNGLLIFSIPSQLIKDNLFSQFQVQDITRKMTPPDFRQTRRPDCTYLIRPL